MDANRDQLLESDNLRVRFRYCEDRYAHEIWLAVDGVWIAVLSSVEGSAWEDWPPSPPLQSLHFEHLGQANQSALLVGMAGKSHWSASVELDPASPCVRFDIACRVRGSQIPALGSAYQAVSEAAALLSRDCKVVLTATAHANVSLEIEVSDQPRQTHLELSEGRVRIAVDEQGAGDLSRTVRWSYTIRAVDGPQSPD